MALGRDGNVLPTGLVTLMAKPVEGITTPGEDRGVLGVLELDVELDFRGDLLMQMSPLHSSSSANLSLILWVYLTCFLIELGSV